MKTGKITLEHDGKNPVHLVVMGDLHVGSREFARKRAKEFLETNMALPQSYLIGMGDHMDTIVLSDRKRFRMSVVDPAYLAMDDPEAILDYQFEDCLALLSPYKGRILGLTRGNHEDQFIKRYGHNHHRRLCNELGCEDLLAMWMKTVLLKDQHKKVRSFKLYGAHGHGGSTRTEGGNVTKYSHQTKYFDADVYLWGHTHDLWYKAMPCVTTNSVGGWMDRTKHLVNTGSFKKGLGKDTVVTWEETMGFPPRRLGGVVIAVRPCLAGSGVMIKVTA